jgi:hypothetical protein
MSGAVYIFVLLVHFGVISQQVSSKSAPKCAINVTLIWVWPFRLREA